MVYSSTRESPYKNIFAKVKKVGFFGYSNYIAAKQWSKKMDYATNLAFFLVEKTGSVLSTWSGKMTANEQRELFGRVLGKGRIVIDGERELISNRVSVCFGHDFDDRNVTRWCAL